MQFFPVHDSEVISNVDVRQDGQMKLFPYKNVLVEINVE